MSAPAEMPWGERRGFCVIVPTDAMEVAPAHDHAEIAAPAAASPMHDCLCLPAMKKGVVPRPCEA